MFVIGGDSSLSEEADVHWFMNNVSDKQVV